MRTAKRACACLVVALVAGLSTAGSARAALPGSTFSGAYGAGYSYEGYVPSSYRSDAPVPLLVALHGCAQSADDFRRLTRFDEVAEANRFIVLFPQQSAFNNPLKCWNFLFDLHRESPEPRAIAAMTSWVRAHYAVDPRRIFVAGVSAGGAMTAVMGATYPDVYAAIAIGSGCGYTGRCTPVGGTDPEVAGRLAYEAMGSRERRMPTLVFHGDEDPLLPPANARQTVRQWQVTADWADDGSRNGSVPSAPTSTMEGAVAGGRAYTVEYYGDGTGAELAQYWLVHGMGHRWGGGCDCVLGADSAAPDESAVIWSFLSGHPRP